MIVATVVPSKNPRIMSAKCFDVSAICTNVTQKKYEQLIIAQNQEK